jgi:hypothetical protein
MMLCQTTKAKEKILLVFNLIRMSEHLPKEVTKENIQGLIELAKKIDAKANQTSYGLLSIFLLAAATVLLVIGSLFLTNWLFISGYFGFISGFSYEWRIRIFFASLFAITILISLPSLTLVNLSISWFEREYLHYPKHSELIFASSFIIAKHLMEGDRLKAKKEVQSFLYNLKSFSKDLFNPRRKVYAPEFNLVRCGKLEVYRMLMFSKKDVSNLLMNFGLAFVRNDEPQAFSHLTELVKQIREYGEPKGRFHKYLTALEQYPNSLSFVLAAIVFIISLLFTIFGYPLRSAA